ncbi:MAG TPA: hypothetical protein VK665_12270, partial [Candidatus Elarobacter sp.]|nr:hypothetical protein [Candidatus Elarobacter sp.]
IMLGKRIAGALFLAAAVLAATPGAGAPASRTAFTPAPSFITCQPGFVYRCNQYGCFCVKA